MIYVSKAMPTRIKNWQEETMGKNAESHNYTYMVRCADKSLYTGWTNDLKKRIAAHNAGKGAKYTKSRLPVELVYYETFATKQEAMSREWHLKKMTRAQKEMLVKEKSNRADKNEAPDEKQME